MRPEFSYNKNIDPKFIQAGNNPFLVKNNPALDLLANKGNEDLLNYIGWLDLYDDPNLVVLSSLHHYFYDAEEMKNVRTLISLICLNEIRDPKRFLHSIYTMLSPRSNLIGFFIDSKKHNGYSLKKNHTDDEAVENGIFSKIPIINTLYNFMDSRTFRNLTANSVIFTLENNGFKVNDITELNGVSYFHAKRI